MFNLILAHPSVSLLVAYIIVMNAVMAMENPDDKSGKGYRWLWKFSHAMVLVLPRVFPALRWGNGAVPEAPPAEPKP